MSLFTPSPAGPVWDVSALERDLPKSLSKRVTRYEDFQHIARGGKADVYACTDTHLGRRVAYKVLDKKLLCRPLEQRMIAREARIMAALDCRAVPTVYEIGRDREGRPFYTMQLLDGPDLYSVLAESNQQQPSPPAEELVAAIVRAARLLATAHDQGVVHGDIKPENLVLGRGGAVWLIDWGLARITSSARGGQLCSPIEESWGRQGSALFMSPEQAAGEAILGPASDIYSLGAVLYECLALRPPLVGENSRQTLELVATQPPKPPGEVAPARHVSDAVQAACLRSLAKRPGDRFASMNAFADTLEAALHDALVRHEAPQAVAYAS